MMTNFKEMMKMETLASCLNIESTKSLNMKQKKAARNIRSCADDQWAWVNSWMDQRDESARAYLLDARELFDTIYSESQKNIYAEGYTSFGPAAESHLKDIRFCGKDFLQKVALYYTVGLLEEAFYEVEGTEEDAAKISEDLKSLKNEIFGKEFTEDIDAQLKESCANVTDGDALVAKIAEILEAPVKVTKKHESWVSLPKATAVVIRMYLKAKESGLEATEKKSKVIYSNENVEIILSHGANPYLWSLKK